MIVGLIVFSGLALTLSRTRIGLLIPFFGLAFLLKYSIDRNLVPPELRVGGVALVGVALLVGGWRLRTKRAAYGLGLQGGGVGVGPPGGRAVGWA